MSQSLCSKLPGYVAALIIREKERFRIVSLRYCRLCFVLDDGMYISLRYH